MTNYIPMCPLPQYAILLTMVLTTFIKYLLHTIDLQSENPWDNKAVYMLYTELFTGIECHLCSAESEELVFICTTHSHLCGFIWNASNTQTSYFIPGFIKVLLYIAFMTIMIKVHTFPLFAIRPMYLAMRWAAACLGVFFCDGFLWCVGYFHFAFCLFRQNPYAQSDCLYTAWNGYIAPGCHEVILKAPSEFASVFILLSGNSRKL